MTLPGGIKLVLMLALAMSASVAHGEVVVIVSSKSSITSLTPEQTSRIFLGKDDKFPNDEFATPIDQPEGDAIRDEFYSKVAHKNPSQMDAYGQNLFSQVKGDYPNLPKAARK